GADRLQLGGGDGVLDCDAGDGLGHGQLGGVVAPLLQQGGGFFGRVGAEIMGAAAVSHTIFLLSGWGRGGAAAPPADGRGKPRKGGKPFVVRRAFWRVRETRQMRWGHQPLSPAVVTPAVM